MSFVINYKHVAALLLRFYFDFDNLVIFIPERVKKKQAISLMQHLHYSILYLKRKYIINKRYKCNDYQCLTNKKSITDWEKKRH